MLIFSNSFVSYFILTPLYVGLVCFFIWIEHRFLRATWQSNSLKKSCFLTEFYVNQPTWTRSTASVLSLAWTISSDQIFSCEYFVVRVFIEGWVYLYILYMRFLVRFCQSFMHYLIVWFIYFFQGRWGSSAHTSRCGHLFCSTDGDVGDRGEVPVLFGRSTCRAFGIVRTSLYGINGLFF